MGCDLYVMGGGQSGCVLEVVIMEEQLKITILGRDLLLSLPQVLRLHPLLHPQWFQEVRLPSSLSRFQPSTAVLQACVYYIWAIEQGDSQPALLQLREICVSAVSSYYISNRMNFELYQYGFLCSRILSTNLERAIHILYFMVYARLASKPYVVALVTAAEKKTNPARRKTVRSQRDYSTHSKSHESRHPTLFVDCPQLEIDHFRKDLKKALSSQTDPKKLARKADSKRAIKRNTPEMQEGETNEWVGSVTVPLKVSPRENSSVINRLKFQSGASRISDDLCIKKLQVRRQKFNQAYETSVKIAEELGCDQDKENKRQQWGTAKAIGDRQVRNYPRNSPHRPYEHFRQIASHIRSANSQLDSIRLECYKHTPQHQRGHLTNEAEINSHISRLLRSPTTSIFPVQKNTVLVDATDSQRKSQKPLLMGKPQPRRISMRKMSGEEIGRGELGPGIITRKNEQSGQQEEQLLLFNRRIKNKFKLQKYKQEYRHFLKTQMFQKVRDIS